MLFVYVCLLVYSILSPNQINLNRNSHNGDHQISNEIATDHL